ncbi:MAG: hypothetical protein ABSA05_06510 [Opitutaceae bacterium]|jgi:hypothetical protein
MLERFVSCVGTDDAGAGEPAAIRARLRGVFAPAFGRRATILGLLIGGVLREALEGDCDAIVYGSTFGETRTLADFLDSFPHPSPTLFQTSVHPSPVQQVMIDRQQPVREYIPLAGRRCLAARVLLTALLCPADRVVLCGGEEHGSWLSDFRMGSDRSFAFAMVLGRSRDASTQGRLRLEPIGETAPEPSGGEQGAMSLSEFFDLLHARRDYKGPVSAEWRLEVEWS